MAEVEFNLGGQIALDAMIPEQTGVPTDLPEAISTDPGVYIILNQYFEQMVPENRYMGITTNFRARFAVRQGSCFELGLLKSTLNGVYAFLGTMRYKNEGGNWTNPDGYDAGNVTVRLDGYDYDFEHILIKGAQNIWPYGTITNTLKVGDLTNQGPNPLKIAITNYWQGFPLRSEIVIPSGETLPK